MTSVERVLNADRPEDVFGTLPPTALRSKDAALTAALPDPRNPFNAWQHGLRLGWPDLVSARYAVSVAGKPDWLALTHLDQVGTVERNVGGWKACAGYLRGAESFNIIRTVPTASELSECSPVYAQVSGGDLPALYSGMFNAEVRLRSFGPRAEDKDFGDERRDVNSLAGELPC